MWAPNSESNSAPPDSSFESSTADLTDITSDRSLLIGLTQDRVSAASNPEDSHLANVVSKLKKSTPQSDTLSDSFVMTIEEKSRGEQERINFPAKGKQDTHEDTTDIDESTNSPIQSDPESSAKDESDFSIEDNNKDKQISPKPNTSKNNSDDLPSTVTLLKTPNGAKVYVVGTAHFSEESLNDVSQVIQKVQPHIVMVELCPQRINILQLDEKTILEEAQSINFEKIRSIMQQNGVFNGLIYLLMLNMSANLTKELGLAPGGEFRRALHEAKKIPQCIVHLGDRPIQITMHRALAALTWVQTAKLVWRLLINDEPISKEDVEKYKQRELLSEILTVMGVEFPALKTVFVHERDIFLTHSLQVAADSEPLNGPARVVGIVGMGHVPGILENWGKVQRQTIAPLMKIPPASLSSRILRTSFKIACAGLVVYIGYKVIPRKWLP